MTFARDSRVTAVVSQNSGVGGSVLLLTWWETVLLLDVTCSRYSLQKPALLERKFQLYYNFDNEISGAASTFVYVSIYSTHTNDRTPFSNLFTLDSV